MGLFSFPKKDQKTPKNDFDSVEIAWEMHRRCATMNYAHLYSLKNEGGINESEFDLICKRQAKALYKCDVSHIKPIERPGFKGIKYSYYDATKLLYITLCQEMENGFDGEYITISKATQEKLLDDDPVRVRRDFITVSAFIRSQSLSSLLDEDSANALEARVVRTLVEKHGDEEFEFYKELKLAWIASLIEGSNPLFSSANRIVQRIWWRIKFLSNCEINPILETAFNEIVIRNSYGFWPKLTSACGLFPD